jgi:hypothetical protein
VSTTTDLAADLGVDEGDVDVLLELLGGRTTTAGSARCGRVLRRTSNSGVQCRRRAAGAFPQSWR